MVSECVSAWGLCGIGALIICYYLHSGGHLLSAPVPRQLHPQNARIASVTVVHYLPHGHPHIVFRGGVG